jgi:putative Holliday junction resolvase
MDERETLIYLGVDWGEKRIGLALGDNETKMATPFKTVGGVKDLVETVFEENADVLVIGHPIKMRGIQEGISAQFLEFIEEVKTELPDKEIILIDERLSSKAADALPGGDMKASRDEVAAMLLLQEYLDGI